jgi:hypothetical protein
MKSEILIQFEGRQADLGELDLVASAEALQGLAASLNIITHSFVHDHEVRSKVPIRKGFNTTLTAAKKGCFELQMSVEFDGSTIQKHGQSVISAKFWDYFSTSIAVATGLKYESKTPYGKYLYEEHPYIFDDIANSIETHLVDTHRPIRSKNAEVARLIRPRVGEQLVLNSDTLEYVKISELGDSLEYLVGNVTKYNILTGRGRAYFQKYGKTVAFFINDITGPGHTAHLQAVASMKEAAERGIGYGGDRHFGVFTVTGSRGQIKRVIADGINKMP